MKTASSSLRALAWQSSELTAGSWAVHWIASLRLQSRISHIGAYLYNILNLIILFNEFQHSRLAASPLVHATIQ